MSSLSLSATLLILSSVCYAAPVQDTTTPVTLRELRPGVFDIIPRGFKSYSPVSDEDEHVFDPSYPKREIQRILSKYRLAANLIHNANLPASLQDLNPSDIIPDDLQASYDGAAVPQVPATSRQATMPLTDYISGNLDVMYYGPIQLGSTNQRMTFDVDTGSADLWVPVNCNNCGHPGYNAQGSSTYKSSPVPFSVTYGSGSVSGKLAQDRVSIGSLTVDNQYFGAVDQESSDFQDQPNDGLIGMAFSTIASSGKPTFFENLISANKVAAPIFSVHLARGQQKGSQVCLGCYDSSKATGSVSWAPVTSKTYWAVSMPGASVNGKPVRMSTGITAAIDTGTTLIYFPHDVATAIYGQIPGAAAANQYGEGFFTYPCSSSLNIAFQFGNNAYSLNTRDFNLGRTASNSPNCVGGIMAMGQGFPNDLAIIGDEFLKSWYTVYDYSHGARVGFAPSVNNS